MVHGLCDLAAPQLGTQSVNCMIPTLESQFQAFKPDWPAEFKLGILIQDIVLRGAEDVAFKPHFSGVKPCRMHPADVYTVALGQIIAFQG